MADGTKSLNSKNECVRRTISHHRHSPYCTTVPPAQNLHTDNGPDSFLQSPGSLHFTRKGFALTDDFFRQFLGTTHGVQFRPSSQ